jgi:hypothetical protein
LFAFGFFGVCSIDRGLIAAVLASHRSVLFISVFGKQKSGQHGFKSNSAACHVY